LEVKEKREINDTSVERMKSIGGCRWRERSARYRMEREEDVCACLPDQYTVKKKKKKGK
jgi:hypothetical protein